ncbi:MipA/OmpV family protein [Variovorax gossypii]|uniref:MipA/OmpV family protein n=1 Tax=Variovorax gossypii TaxID=1679495 RepID=A0A3S0J6F7_9BURK|nr:MipA/OmpV family protein [Variovorax gossypii]RTQ34890.1 MipA/OmpV family protein [Variovorax gossypii]
MIEHSRLSSKGRKRLARAPFKVIAASAACAACLSPAWAQLAEGTSSSSDAAPQWGVGIGVSMERKAYREFNDKTQAMPMLTYENKWVSVAFPGVDVKLPSAGPVSFRLRARYAGDGYEADDSPYLAGMDKRKGGIWLGGAAIWRNDIANLSAELLADGSGNSKGTRFKVQVDRRFSAGAFGFTPRLAAQWADRKYVDYYYGVTAVEARPDRAEYAGKATTNVEVGLRVDYAVAPRQTVFLDVSATSFGSGIKNSPLVGRSNQTGVRLGYVYRF